MPFPLKLGSLKSLPLTPVPPEPLLMKLVTPMLVPLKLRPLKLPLKPLLKLLLRIPVPENRERTGKNRTAR
ncbi:hypothetical protein TR75_05170 [Hydrogenibacillus schlegelii]|uniref:Uncharacterized protein n=1 Tax=Hydrogenibacillus schlegelii TaxID=1484 RepID=A0A132N9Q6_HYDSH|nr:hypothetical protein TR75_05170 [Hydrogenibacillus schlegelii]OAR05167.1 hypothetical protein SA87_08450 [Hydrogenibacillus schlegelii]